MTRDEIAEASEEQLRIWVAEKVMGWRWLLPPGADCAVLLPPSFDNPHWKPAPNGIVACDDYQETMARYGGTWPTDITAAWQVVERMMTWNARWLADNDLCNDQSIMWSFRTGDRPLHYQWYSAEAPKGQAPIAICKAALLAVMGINGGSVV